MTKNYIEYVLADFIINVYETFRYKICPNTNNLYLLWSDHINIAQSCDNIIYINIEDIYNQYIEYIDDFDNYIHMTKEFILEVIIHELYHVEQSSINILYNNSEKYNIEIENQVMYMTYIFLLQNSYYIYNIFGIYLDDYKLKTKMNAIVNDVYVKLYDRYDENCSSYCLNIIIALISKGGDHHSTVINILNNIDKIKNIKLIINKKIYDLKKNFIYNTNYDELNQLANRYLSYISLSGEIETNIKFDYDTFTINVNDNSLKLLFNKRN